MARVSFDYDGTFGANHKMRCFAKVLIRYGHEVWITTARYENLVDYGPAFLQKYNITDLNKAHVELFRQTDWCGIPRDQIKFCNMKPKAEFFLYEDFLWHVDDDPEEIDQINADTTTIGVSCKTGNWLQTCRDLIKKCRPTWIAKVAILEI